MNEAKRNTKGAKAIFSLSNLGCPSAGTIENRLKKLKGVREAYVNCVTNMLLIDYDPDELTAEDIRGFLRKMG